MSNCLGWWREDGATVRTDGWEARTALCASEHSPTIDPPGSYIFVPRRNIQRCRLPQTALLNCTPVLHEQMVHLKKMLPSHYVTYVVLRKRAACDTAAQD